MPTTLVATDAYCFHCLTPESEDAPVNALGICQRCANKKRIRRLYKPRSDRPEWWPQHLERLAARARLKLPLFPETESETQEHQETDHGQEEGNVAG